MVAEEVKKQVVPAGRWAFLTGLIIAVVSATFVIPHLSIILFLLGLVVGSINVREGETTSFLTAVLALVIVGIAGIQFGTLTEMIDTIFKNFTAFASAAALVVALRDIFSAAKPR
ncbi:MAG: hypothetical protein O2U61_02815 [Candidatus Bathyarchaeota archaeon]|nr:hypothetical protein [Candidatus Bathyarchaeota archaeon]